MSQEDPTQRELCPDQLPERLSSADVGILKGTFRSMRQKGIAGRYAEIVGSLPESIKTSLGFDQRAIRGSYEVFLTQESLFGRNLSPMGIPGKKVVMAHYSGGEGLETGEITTYSIEDIVADTFDPQYIVSAVTIHADGSISRGSGMTRNFLVFAPIEGDIEEFPVVNINVALCLPCSPRRSEHSDNVTVESLMRALRRAIRKRTKEGHPHHHKRVLDSKRIAHIRSKLERLGVSTSIVKLIAEQVPNRNPVEDWQEDAPASKPLEPTDQLINALRKSIQILKSGHKSRKPRSYHQLRVFDIIEKLAQRGLFAETDDTLFED